MVKKNPLKSSAPAVDRRRHTRVDIFAVTRYFCALRKQEVGVQTRIADLSESGAMLLTFGEAVPLDMSVLLSFHLPGAESVLVSVEGKIRHASLLERDLYRSGLEFLNVKENDLKAIRKYISQKKRK